MTIEDLKELRYYAPKGEIVKTTYLNACGCMGADGDYSNSIGNPFAKIRRAIKTKGKRDVESSKQQQQAINAITEQNAKDTSLQDAIKATEIKETSTAKKGMSLGVKIGIGVAVLAVIGGGVWYYIKHKKK